MKKTKWICAAAAIALFAVMLGGCGIKASASAGAVQRGTSVMAASDRGDMVQREYEPTPHLVQTLTFRNNVSQTVSNIGANRYRIRITCTVYCSGPMTLETWRPYLDDFTGPGGGTFVFEQSIRGAEIDMAVIIVKKTNTSWTMTVSADVKSGGGISGNLTADIYEMY